MENIKKISLSLLTVCMTYILFQLIFCYFLNKFLSSFGGSFEVINTFNPFTIINGYSLILSQLNCTLVQLVWFIGVPISIWVFTVLFIFVIINKFSSILSPKKDNSKVYGDARWASLKDLKQAGFLSNKKGIVLGETDMTWGNKLIIESSSNEHVLIYGPSRSGKNGLIIPSIFTWQDSMVVIDPKNELYDSTAEELRRNGYIVYKVSLGELYNKYNPLDGLTKGDKTLFKEANEIANILLESSQVKGENIVFTRNAVTLLRAIIIYMVEQGEVINLRQLAYMVSGLDIKTGKMYQIKDLLAKMKNSSNPQVAADANRFYEDANMSSAKTFRSFMTDIEKNLAIFKDEVLGEITKTSDFSVFELLDLKKPPIALFITTPSVDAITGAMDSVSKLILHNVLVNALYKTGRRVQDKNGNWNKRNLLILWDELTSGGKFDPLEKLLADAGGFGAKFCLAAQDEHQIIRYYGPNNSIFASCTHKVIYTPNDTETGEKVSKFLGNYTYEQKQTSTSTQFHNSRTTKSTTVAYHPIQKPLLSANEVLRLPPTRSIILTQTGQTKLSIYGKKFKFYENKEFMAKVNLSLETVKKAKALESKYEKHEDIKEELNLRS